MKNKISKNKKFHRFGISDCYEDFKSESNHFSFKEYRTIIKAFLTIYFYEFFFFKHPIYFIFGGKIQKNKISENVKIYNLKSKDKNIISIRNNVGVLWYDRPFKLFNEFTFKKLIGSTSSFKAIEKEWLKENDCTKLPTINELKQKGLKFYKE